jgi:hypothetical protein
MRMRILGISATVMTTLIVLLVLFCLRETAFADEFGAGQQQYKSRITLYSFIKPMGISALSCVLVTFTTGLFRRRLGKRFLMIHRILAWLTVGLALLHGALVLTFF